MTEAAGRPAAAELYRAIHDRARLGVVTCLASRGDAVAFSELARLRGLTASNLSRHLAVLEEAGYGAITNAPQKNRPLTTCRLTPLGGDRFLAHVAVLERIVAEAEAARVALSVHPLAAPKPA